MWGTGFFKGMWITLKNLIRGPITMQYPYEKWELPERARWAVAPKFDEAGAPKCTACMNCVRACPDGVLHLYAETNEDKSKTIREFAWEVGACMFCGLCVEACPFDALEMSKEYELAVSETNGLRTTLLKEVSAASAKRKADGEAKPTAKKIEGETPVAETAEQAAADAELPAQEQPAAQGDTPVPDSAEEAVEEAGGMPPAAEGGSR